MGQYNVLPSFIAGQEARRASDEDNYIAARRAVVDPREDKRAADIDAARAANIATYGVEAADPTSLGQLKGIKQRDELHPIAVKQADATLEGTTIGNEGAKGDNAAKIDERTRAASGRMLAGLANSGAKTPDEARAYFASLPPDVLAQTGTDPAKLDQLIEHLGEHGDFQGGVRALRYAMGTPERVSQVVSGLGPDGKPVNMAIGEDQAPGALPVTPDDRKHGVEMAQAQATLEATRALTNQRNRPPAAKAGAVSPQQAAAAAARANMLIDDAMGLVAEGARKGYIASENQDAFTRAGAQLANIPIVGPALQGVADPKAQTLRDQITGKTNALLREYTKAMGIMSTSINSNFELQNIQAIIRNADSSAEAQLEAMRTVKGLLADPNFAARVVAAENNTAPADAGQTTGSGLPPDIEDLVNQYAPGTD